MKSLRYVSLAALILVAGCAASGPGTQTPPPEPVPAPPEPPPPQPSARLGEQISRDALKRAEQAYDEGDYVKTVSILKGGEAVFSSATPATRQAAMKLEAFSYCLSNQPTECRDAFVRIRQAYPKFELSVAESKHPLWAPAFDEAKKMKR